MELSKNRFENLLEKLEIIETTCCISVQDEVGEVIEYDTSGNGKHLVNDTIFEDGSEYDLTEEQKDVLFAIAKNEAERIKKEYTDLEDSEKYENNNNNYFISY